MANYHNFKSIIVFNKDLLVNDSTVTKVFTIPKNTGAETAKPLSLEIYTNNET